MWHKAEWMGRPMRLELTRVGLLAQLANRYTTRGALLSIAFRTMQHRDFLFFISLSRHVRMKSLVETGLKPKRLLLYISKDVILFWLRK